MNLLREARRRAPQLHRRTTNTTFCQLFAKELKSLYLLSLLLTADPELAGECVLSSLDDCLNGVDVSADWAHVWAKRTVIKNAIRLIGPALHSTTAKARERGAHGSSHEHPAISDILALRDFERIVFVMCVLEQYSDRDSATLLGRKTQEIEEARVRALRRVAKLSI
jgi:hypothetical protein